MAGVGGANEALRKHALDCLVNRVVSRVRWRLMAQHLGQRLLVRLPQSRHALQDADERARY
jgi:hypothetical protein